MPGSTGTGLDVEVSQDVVVDLGGDLLLLQHLLDGFVSGAGSDLSPFPAGLLGLKSIRSEVNTFLFCSVPKYH